MRGAERRFCSKASNRFFEGVCMCYICIQIPAYLHAYVCTYIHAFTHAYWREAFQFQSILSTLLSNSARHWASVARRSTTVYMQPDRASGRPLCSSGRLGWRDATHCSTPPQVVGHHRCSLIMHVGLQGTIIWSSHNPKAYRSEDLHELITCCCHSC